MALPSSPGQWHRRIWALSWPVIIANITIPLVGLVDTAVMGQMPEPAYLGAVAVGATIFSAIYWIFGFLRMGTTGLAAQALGAGQPKELIAVGARAASIALALGLSVLALQVPLQAFALWLFEASDQVETLAASYFAIRIWGAPALMIYMVCLGLLFGMQQVRATLIISILVNVSNVLLDLLFVLDFGWGVPGVAAATVISEWLAATAAVMIVLRVMRLRGWLHGWPHDLWSGERVANLFQMSGNLIIRSFFVQLPFFAFTLIGAGIGDLTLAANAIIMQLFFTMAFGLDGMAHTAETLTGYAFGGRDREGFRQATLYSLGWAVLLAIAIAVLYALTGEKFVYLLTSIPEVRVAAVNLLPWAVAGPLVAVWAFHLDGVFIGTTQTALLRNCMFVAALIYLLTLWLTLDVLGNTGLWIAMMVFFASRGILLGSLYPRLERSLTNSSG